jgi:hypothetical protein
MSYTSPERTKEEIESLFKLTQLKYDYAEMIICDYSKYDGTIYPYKIHDSSRHLFTEKDLEEHSNSLHERTEDELIMWPCYLATREEKYGGGKFYIDCPDYYDEWDECFALVEEMRQDGVEVYLYSNSVNSDHTDKKFGAEAFPDFETWPNTSFDYVLDDNPKACIVNIYIQYKEWANTRKGARRSSDGR